MKIRKLRSLHDALINVKVAVGAEDEREGDDPNSRVVWRNDPAAEIVIRRRGVESIKASGRRQDCRRRACERAASCRHSRRRRANETAATAPPSHVSSHIRK